MLSSRLDYAVIVAKSDLLVRERRHQRIHELADPYWLPAGETVEQLFDFLRGFGYETRDARVIDFEGYKIGDYLLSA